MGDSSSSESSQSVESKDDECTNKKAKLRVNSVKPSIDLEAQKVKMFAKNKKLLLEVSVGSIVELLVDKSRTSRCQAHRGEMSVSVSQKNVKVGMSQL